MNFRNVTLEFENCQIDNIIKTIQVTLLKSVQIENSFLIHYTTSDKNYSVKSILLKDEQSRKANDLYKTYMTIFKNEKNIIKCFSQKQDEKQSFFLIENLLSFKNNHTNFF